METLGTYSNLRGGENPALALIEDAKRWRTPSGNRNEVRLRKRIRRLSASEIDELAAAYEAGDSVYTLGRRYGIHRTTVSEHLRRAGVEIRRTSRVK
ncbi:helix-turn-helix domain-containing protein [Pseudactinotalea sp. Z1739]|uniref:helix-turn-helix domain-containing protein n=1 Tax=Pseudactinotalea sp. Z1739 TaxID=3413028 RepID=UPI003C7C9561